MKFIYITAGIITLSLGNAQVPSSDISPPKQRDEVVDAAIAILASRSAPASVLESVPNPFQWPAEAETVDISPTKIEEVKPIMGLELLGKLAAQIPVTGTVNLGGQPILLLGQKRLKVGDTVTISLDGQNYDLSIAAIASTSFTVKRGEYTHTRATRISSSASRP